MLASRATGDASASRPRVLLHIERDSAWAQELEARAELDVRRVSALDEAAGDLIVCSEPSLSTIRDLRARGVRLPVVVVLESDAADSIARAFTAGATEIVVPGASVAEAVAVCAGLGESGQIRHRVRLAVTLARAGAAPEAASLEALSVSEAQVRAPGRLEPGDLVSLELPLARESAPLPLRAVVRGSAPASGSTVARLRLVGISPTDRTTLERWLEGLDRETRSTDPADAFVSLRRLDRSAAAAALTSSEAPEWLAQSIALLSDDDRAALASKSEDARARSVFARLRAEALAHVLERFDPALDGEPTGARETVLHVIDALVAADAEAVRRDTSDDPIARAAVRLKRAVAARLPHLAAAYEAALGRSNALHKMDAAERAVSRAFARRTKHRVYAVIAGVILGGTVVYSVIATLSGR